MKSFSDILPKLNSMPLIVAWTLQNIAEKRGCQDLYTRQSPDKLRRLREYAMIESAVASNRIEGVEIDQDRVGSIVFGNGIMRDRDEEEVRGYRQALELIHTSSDDLPLSVDTICRLHALTRPSIWDSGKIREKECEIIQTYPDGTSRVRFRAVAPEKVREYLEYAIEGYENVLRDARVPALVALAAFNLDFLCIHPFRDGNGRVSRLLLLFMLYRLGYEAGRYVSMERLIELSKERYYETLEKSSVSWHDGKHDIWPYVEYLLFKIDELYQGFQQRFLQLATRRGEKSTNVIEALNAKEGEFTVRQIEFECPGVSRETIKAVLKKNSGCFVCTGHGVSARWRRIKKIGPMP